VETSSLIATRGKATRRNRGALPLLPNKARKNKRRGNQIKAGTSHDPRKRNSAGQTHPHSPQRKSKTATTKNRSGSALLGKKSERVRPRCSTTTSVRAHVPVSFCRAPRPAAVVRVRVRVVVLGVRKERGGVTLLCFALLVGVLLLLLQWQHRGARRAGVPPQVPTPPPPPPLLSFPSQCSSSATVKRSDAAAAATAKANEEEAHRKCPRKREAREQRVLGRNAFLPASPLREPS
jgi:hypothetical protein